MPPQEKELELPPLPPHPMQTDPPPSPNRSVLVDNQVGTGVVDRSPAAVLSLSRNSGDRTGIHDSSRRSPVARQLNPSLDMNRAIENSMARDVA
jgi:hypothetical protein